MKDGLIATQVALSLLLLVIGGLFVRTLRNLKTQDVGFSAANVLSIQLGAQRDYQPEWAAVIVPLLQRIQAIPGVLAATVSTNATLDNNGSGVNGLKVDGYVSPTRDDQRARANWVAPGYFETSRIPLVDGRGFSAADNSGAGRVAVINQAMARHYFGSARAVGRRFEFNARSYEIIGVAKDAKYTDLRAPSPRFVYFAVLQGGGVHSLEVRTLGPPLALAAAVRAAVRETDPRLRIGSVTTLADRVHGKLGLQLLVADITGFFGGLTLLLVSVGIYGTVAYAVAARTNEIGIRMALGARPASVQKMVLRDVLVVLAVGLAAGLAAALVGGRMVASMLYGLGPADLTTIALAALVLTVTALVAGYIPARRASRVDPLTTLRVE